MSFFPKAVVVKKLPASTRNIRDRHLIPGLERSLGVENGTAFQYSCLENFMGRESWQATVHGTTKSQTQLSDQAYVDPPIKV